MIPIVLVVLVISQCSRAIHVISQEKSYQPTWDSLDSRPRPQWYDDAKIGIFIHWGVFSVPSFGSEWFWFDWKNENATGAYGDFMKKNYPPDFSYQDFGREFTAEFYDPDAWANLFASSGAQYIVLTSKHHEGYTLWPSKYSYSWNAMDVGPHRDLLGDLANSVRNLTSLRLGLYHSLYEWFNPLYLKDKQRNFETDEFVTHKTLPELIELVEKYRPDVIWSDGDWEANDTYWKSKEFLAWLYNDSPVKDSVVVNDRWGYGTGCAHGDFFNCADRYSPGTLQPHKWENAMTIDKHSWGFRRNAQLGDYMKIEDLLAELVPTVSCGGNILINVGPTKEGTINPIFEERLRQMGEWLSVNGEAIYGSIPWTFQNDTVTPGIWYTKNEDAVYAIALNYPNNTVLTMTAPKLNSESTITLLADSTSRPLKFELTDDAVDVWLPALNTVTVPWAYVLKLTNVQS